MMVFILLLLVQLTTQRQCLYADQHQTTLLNLFHELSIQGNCYPCLPQCRQCQSIDDAGCNEGNCENGYFYHQNKCSRCPQLCEQCSSANSCTKCIEGYYLDDSSGQCRQCEDGAAVCTFSSTLMCSNGYYYEVQSFICKKCMSNCETCQQSSICIRCMSGYLLSSNAQQCNKCEVEHCVECLSVSSCNRCDVGYELMSSSLCLVYSCSLANCLQCESGSCSLCQPQYYLYGGSCYYGSSLMCALAQNNTDYGSCLECANNAQLAQNTNSYCIPTISPSKEIFNIYSTFTNQIICQTPYVSGTAKINSIAISETIKSAYTLQLTATLVSPSTNIQVSLGYTSILISEQIFWGSLPCDKYANHLTVKMKKVWKISTNTHNLEISFNHDDGVIVRQLLLSLKLCLSDNCLQCISATVCQVCEDPYFMEEYGCVLSCGDGYYTNTQLKTCVAFCQNGYYPDDLTFRCQRCPLGCQMCQSQLICTSCSVDYYLQDNNCSLSCRSQYLYPAQSGICELCLNPCKTCMGQGLNCTSCRVGYLYDNYCVAVCPSMYYASVLGGNPSCLQCQLPCLQCQIYPTMCTKCHSNMTLHEGKCIGQCPSTYYQDNNECLKCLNPCSECVGLNNCSRCAYGILYGEACVNTCPNGYYHQFTNNTCTQCQVHCLECGQQCVLCDNSTSLENGKCVTSCTNGISINGTCERCLYPCSVCVELDCYGCEQGYYYREGICYLRCPNGTYPNTTTQQCEDCRANCERCGQWDECIECGNGSLLIDGQCYDGCPSHTYIHNSVCLQCSTTCKQCIDMPQYCTQCYDDYSRYMVNNVSICVDDCPIGYYDANGKCQLCDDVCYSCVGSSNSCLSCILNHYLLNAYCISENECINRTGHYPSYGEMICQPCQPPCVDCESEGVCVECGNATYLHYGKCLAICPDGYYQSINVCVGCNAECTICSSGDNCSECSDGHYLMGDECVSVCPDSYYGYDISGTCQKCRYPCESCTSMLTCTTCLSSLILHNEQCLEACPQGTYLHNNSCTDCPSNCIGCESQTVCSSCAANYYYYQSNNSCIESCPPTYYPYITNKCQECVPPCVECRSEHECENCVVGYLYKEGYCYVSCPIGSYPSIGMNSSLLIDQRLCLNCPSLCAKCESESECSECETDGVLLDDNNDGKGICLSECPPSMYSFESSCYNCSSNCLSCSGIRTNCTSCNGTLLEDGKCVTGCQQSYYYDNATGNCQKCGPECSHCIDEYNCLQCFHAYLNEEAGTCSQECSLGTFKNSQTFICESCQTGCMNCTTALACIRCEYPYVLYNIKCIQGPCPSILFYFQKQNRCYENCEEEGLLTDNDNRLCYSVDDGCAQPLVAKNNICLSQCSDGQYINSNVECVKGSSPHEFLVQAVSYSHYIELYVLFVEKDLLVREEWVNEFDVKVQYMSRRLLQSEVNVRVEPSPQIRSNILVLRVTFQQELSISNLKLKVQVKNPHKSIYHEGVPLQNWQYEVNIQNYYVDYINIDILALGVVMLVVSVLFSLVSLYFQSKPYLLSSIWQYLQFFYLLSYVNVQWPNTVGPLFYSLAPIYFRWYTFPQPHDILVFSPQKYYVQSYDMNLIPNISINLIIFVVVIGFILLCKFLSVFSFSVQPYCERVWKYTKYLLIIVVFLTYSNIILYSGVNVFYSPPSPLQNDFSFSLLLSYVILVGGVLLLIVLFKMQWENKNALDGGINICKKRIIIALPLYRVFRRIILIISLAIYSDNSAHMVCLGLVSTAFIFTLISWYQPFANQIRYKCTLLQQAMFFLFLLFVFVYVLNPSLDPQYGSFLAIWALLVFLSTLIYPTYCLYILKKTGQSPQPYIDQNEPVQIQRNDSITEQRKKTLKIVKNVKVEGETDHEADESSQDDKERRKAEIDRRAKLQEMNVKVVKQFKNYDLDDNSDVDNDLERQQMEFSRIMSEKKKNLSVYQNQLSNSRDRG